MQVFTRVHIPLLAALTAVGAGVQLLIEEAAHGHLEAGAAWALCGGAALYLLCLTVVQRVAGRADVDRVARALAGAALLALAVAAGALTPVALAAGAAAALLVLVVVEVRRGRPAGAKRPRPAAAPLWPQPGARAGSAPAARARRPT